MTEKIVFNGQEFDSADAMPADVRKQYEDVMRLLADSGQAPPHGLDAIRKILSVKTNVSTRIVVNGKEYHSSGELPPEIRTALDRGLRLKVALPVRQLLLFLGAALFFGWWFMHRR
ncbi:MAG TPA: hypothetical protein VLV16_02345 [Gemmatimonadales bacterium]|nr:hypothetical protein [Gemmatimonadales bacterium]